ncbi:10672_t:CDS:2, partial [Scutellospora calospora]
LVEDLRFFEIRNKLITLFITQCLSYLKTLLQSEIINQPISKEMRFKFEENLVDTEIYIVMFSIQCFDSQFIQIQHHNITYTQKFKNLKNQLTKLFKSGQFTVD